MPSMLELYEKLKPKLGEEEARTLLEFIESSVERRAATKEDLERVKADLLKWMFAFWVGNVAAVAGILFALLRS